MIDKRGSEEVSAEALLLFVEGKKAERTTNFSQLVNPIIWLVVFSMFISAKNFILWNEVFLQK
ncbi:hypothetical protein [Pseudobacillus badius]|uniref:hypothetical protein n=1 Tax=Bacillus badius TaxID=1455 RepID=UPI0007B05CF7|nr:hypothetical protein [Bacillus badius]KZO00077.1 hypothetical protein A4244_04030 [Bacillus badius]OCS86238.1 hypothetical protein A6M11_04025 [Bacillus badius]OVE52300.1 hypothetical protein B1A98_07860 [Bacillus badius]UAT30425.1 hypothetical protein K7T73_18110 [Bacillus badius]